MNCKYSKSQGKLFYKVCIACFDSYKAKQVLVHVQTWNFNQSNNTEFVSVKTIKTVHNLHSVRQKKSIPSYLMKSIIKLKEQG